MANWGEIFADAFSKSFEGQRDRSAQKALAESKANSPESIILAKLAQSLGGVQQPEIMPNVTTGGMPGQPMQDPRQQFEQSRGLSPQVVDPISSIGLKTDPAIEALRKQQSLMPGELTQKKLEGEISAKTKWNTEDSERKIKFDVLTPKLQNYMEVGGRAYQELRDVANNVGIDLNFEKGGISALMANATKNVAMAAKLAPLMTSLERLRPELGTELMRQLGAFRSGEMADKFSKTLAQFSGDIREDIANMSTTLAKNKANTVLLDEEGNELSNEERNKKIDSFEANLVRKYNFMYRGMGLMTKPYTAKRSFEWLAENSEFNEAENTIIENAVNDNPKYDRTKIIAKLIEKGLL